MRAFSWFARLLAVCFAALVPATMAQQPQKAELVEVHKIWDQAPHNAFTDLVRFKDRWFCTFREGQAHVSADGALRILTSRDGVTWTSAALLSSPTADLRDPKLSITPDRRLMLSTAAALHQPAEFRHQSLAWFSADGKKWNGPVPVGEPNMWLWRVTWHDKQAYGVGYSTVGGNLVRLYTSRDGARFVPFVETLFNSGSPSEASILFAKKGTAFCLLRRDGRPASAQLGSARRPYRDWTWKDLGSQLGGPHLVELPGAGIVAAGRLYDGSQRTSLCWLDPVAGTLTEFLTLPSAGDSSYPGLVFHRGLLWVSYYSSHEGKTSIYLAKVKFTNVR